MAVRCRRASGIVSACRNDTVNYVDRNGSYCKWGTFAKMKRPPRAHYRKVNDGFWDPVLDGLATVTMGPAGLDEFDPPLYPRDAQARDLERIGGDMYAAFKPWTKSLGELTPRQAQVGREDPAEGANFPFPEVLMASPEGLRDSTSESAAFPDPLPPPAMYRGYEEVLAGSAERVLRMAEKEQAHRIKWEDGALRRASNRRERGLSLDTLVALSSLAVAALLAMNGHDWVAGVIGGAGIAGPAVSLVRKIRD